MARQEKVFAHAKAYRSGCCAALTLALVLGAAPAWAVDAGPGAAATLPGDAAAAGSSEAGAAAPANASDGGPTGADGRVVDAGMPDWAPKLSATVKPVTAALGDPIAVTIRVRHRKGVSVTLPLALELGEFVELGRSESSRDIGKEGHIADTERTFVVKVAAYDLGDKTLPPIEVTALGPGGTLLTLKTTGFPLRIKSVMGNEPKPKLKDVAPPVDVWQRTWWLLYTLIAVGAAGVIVVATLLVSRRLRARREAAKPPPPPTPAHVIALGRLSALDVEAHIAEERYKELYLLLSEIIRGYVGNRWGFDALEMTTTEINQALDKRRVAPELRGRFDAYFNDCDLVKFAKFRPDPDAARATAAEAEQIVRDTRVPESPAQVVAHPAAQAAAAPGAAGETDAPG